jgi:6-pyruvoyltetrahydropterin/6-carboxytetrahydropterin synthase
MKCNDQNLKSHHGAFHMMVESQFCAAHAIRDYPGPCCHLHGHNYRVVAHLRGGELDALGMLIDYAEVKRALASILAPFDHAYLNELPDFATANPTSEEIARVLYYRLQEALFTTEDVQRRVRISELIVYESDRQGVGYGEE